MVEVPQVHVEVGGLCRSLVVTRLTRPTERQCFLFITTISAKSAPMQTWLAFEKYATDKASDKRMD